MSELSLPIIQYLGTPHSRLFKNTSILPGLQSRRVATTSMTGVSASKLCQIQAIYTPELYSAGSIAGMDVSFFIDGSVENKKRPFWARWCGRLP